MGRFLLLAALATKTLAQIQYGKCMSAIYAFQDDPLVYGANTFTASLYESSPDSQLTAKDILIAEADRFDAAGVENLQLAAQYRKHVRCVVGAQAPADSLRAGVDRLTINLAVNPFQCCDYLNDDVQNLITCNTCVTLPVPTTCNTEPTSESATGRIELCGGAACPTCVPDVEKDTEEDEFVTVGEDEIHCTRDSYAYEIRAQGTAVTESSIIVRATPTHAEANTDSLVTTGTCVVSPGCQAADSDPTGTADPVGLPWCFSREDPSKWGYCVKTCETEEAKLLTDPLLIFMAVLVLIILFIVISFCEQRKDKIASKDRRGGGAFDNIGAGGPNAEFAAPAPANAPLPASPAAGSSTTVLVD